MIAIDRRRVLHLTALAAASLPFRARLAAEPAPAAPPAGDSWAVRAERIQQSILARHWDDHEDLFFSRLPHDPADRKFDYWWQAQALDTLVDGFERTNDRAYLDRGKRLFRGIVKRNGGLTNDYYDDMLWLALALQRLHRHDSDPALAAAVRELWQDIRGGQTDLHGGGISWCKKQVDYKSVPANAPAVILGARLYRESKDPADLELAERVHAWLIKTLMDPDSGMVWDGINRNGDGQIDRRWIFSYNQGTFLGASLELFRATGRPEYLAAAERTARSAEEKLVGTDGIMGEGGRGDGGLFKGIFVRYLGALAQHDRERGAGHAAFLTRQAEAAWKRGQPAERPVFPGSWRSDTGRGGENELGPQISTLALIEQVAALQKT